MKKILVIDDDENLRVLVGMALSHRGYLVLEAGNGAEGIEKAREELPDLILSDVNMDKMNGYVALSNLRKEAATASIPFILMTGMPDNAGMRHGMELGADDYLPKPFKFDALYAAVEARLKKAEAVREEADRRLADLRDAIGMALPHELRTPLNGIIAYGEILEMDAESLPPAEIAEMGQVIVESGRRLERLVENFLIYTQLELVRTDPAKMASLRGTEVSSPSLLISDRARQQAEMAGRSADLRLALFDASVPMSEEYLSKVVDELTQNAFKFSAKGTGVRVEFKDEGAVLVLTVNDQGRGLSPDQIAKVGAYMQFDRKLQEQQGLGLGLNIAKRLTELHGGVLTIQSQKGVGTSVEVRLPKIRSNGSQGAIRQSKPAT